MEPDERVVADASGDTDDANAGAGVAVEDGARGDEDGEGDEGDGCLPELPAGLCSLAPAISIFHFVTFSKILQIEVADLLTMRKQ